MRGKKYWSSLPTSFADSLGETESFCDGPSHRWEACDLGLLLLCQHLQSLGSSGIFKNYILWKSPDEPIIIIYWDSQRCSKYHCSSPPELWIKEVRQKNCKIPSFYGCHRTWLYEWESGLPDNELHYKAPLLTIARAENTHCVPLCWNEAPKITARSSKSETDFFSVYSIDLKKRMHFLPGFSASLRSMENEVISFVML